MKRILLITIILLSLSKIDFAQKFTAGNLVVYRVGTGTTALSGVATTVFLDEYTPTGTFVRSVKLPSVAAEATGTNKRVTASGSATSEGFFTRSANGLYLIAEGYDADTATAAIGKTLAGTVNRVAATIDVNANINSSNVSPSFSSGNNFRSIASVDGNSFYLGGGATGIGYMPVQTGGVDSAIQLSTTVTNVRCIEIFGGQLYISSASGTPPIRIATVGTGLPTTKGQTMTDLPGVTVIKSSPYQFFIATLPAGQVLYIADDSAGIRKYSLVSGNWVANDSLKITAANSGAGFRGITGVVNGNNVGLYVTYAGSGVSGIYGIADSTGFNKSILQAIAVPLATAGTNTAFRGIALAPVATPVPLQLTNFNAALQNNKVLVNWIMADETNELNYTVEKSIDGKNFKVVSNVSPSGISKYAITDADFTGKTTVYYRLKVTGTDGKINYSNIVVVNVNIKHTTVSVYPNPAADFVVVNHTVAKNATIRIHKTDGTLLMTEKATDGALQTYISISSLAKGNYVVTYADESSINSVMFDKF